MNKHSKARVFSFVVVFSLCLLMLCCMLIPNSAQIVNIPINDKMMHIYAFASLTLIVSMLTKFSIAKIMVCAFLFGVLIEIVQPVFGRNQEILDALANGLGILVGSVLGRLAANSYYKYI